MITQEYRRDAERGPFKTHYTIHSDSADGRITIVRNHNHEGLCDGHCYQDDLYYVKAQGISNDRTVHMSFSDEEMQELFMAYLAVRKEMGVPNDEN